MKRILTLLSLLVICLTSIPAQAQRNPWWFGAGIGGTFQSSDMAPRAGLAWDINAAKYTRLESKSPIFLGVRFRFLDGRSTGFNYHRHYGLANNPTVNGSSSVGANYAANGGFMFSNYKFRYDEFAMELVLGSNSLRKRGILLYGFGGAGMTYWKTKTNLFDANGQHYNYLAANIDTTGRDVAFNGLNTIWDDTYESNADGSTTAQWSFMTNAGIGFGYQFKNSFAIGIEHRTTFAMNDIIDGQRWTSTNKPTGDNDVYHYTGMFLRFTFGRTETTDNTNYPPPPPPPVVNNNNPNFPPPNNNNTVVNNNDPIQNQNNTTNNNSSNQGGLPPQVTFTTPNVDPYSTSVAAQSLVVSVYNVTDANQITLSINNQVVPRTTFTFNANTHQMYFNHTLLNGTNVYAVTATNQYGSDSETQTINLNGGGSHPNPTGVPPVVTIVTPNTDPYTSLTPTTNVVATVLNVTSSNQIVVRRNGVAINGWNFNNATHQVTFVANLQVGNNSYEVVGTNPYGTASDATLIIFKPSQPGGNPPVVTITNPAACPHQTKTQNMTITATVTNVTNPSKITVLFNNAPVNNFNFNAQTGVLSFPVVLVNGNNPFSISATNDYGSNAKNCVITYKPQQSGNPPVVTITNPAACPTQSKVQNMTLTGTVTNVTSASEITVLFNNATVNNFTFNAQTGVVSFPVVLVSGNNPFSISATNAFGSDAENCVITYKPQQSGNPPVVTITNPTPCPAQSKVQNMTITGTVTNVMNASEISVSFNNASVNNFTFNAQTGVVSFPVVLVSGNNPFSISATNAFGSDAKNCVITYKPTQSGPPPTVNITTPATNPFVSPMPTGQVVATVMNVTTANQITVKRGNTNVAFTFDPNTHLVSFTHALVAGDNTYVITATNAYGTANDQVTIKFVSPSGGNGNGSGGASESNGGSRPGGNSTSGNGSGGASESNGGSRPGGGNNGPMPSADPMINFVSPAGNTHTTNNSSLPVTMQVLNIASSADIRVKINGVLTNNFSYNAATKTLTFTATLVSGTNTIEVKAMNQIGYAQKLITVTYTPSSRTTKPGGKKAPTKTETKKEEPKKEEPKKETPKSTETKGSQSGRPAVKPAEEPVKPK
ncbi:MAG: hypothetical protein ACRCYO_00175 [Bacteroidia bacterium]